MHVVGAAIITLLGPVQIMNALKNLLYTNHLLNCTHPIFEFFHRIHRYTGIVYVLGFWFSATGGLIFILFNGTVAGIKMSIPFAIYGILMLVVPTITVYYAVFKRNLTTHYYWAIITFSLGNSSIFYRTLYQITCLIFIECGKVTFKGPIDYVFDWLFFAVPLILAAGYILLLYFQKKRPQASR
jgi:hypothetical protein